MFSSSLRRVLPALCIVSLAATLHAKSERNALNSIYVEGLGPALAYSLNYERLVINDLGVRAGLSFISFSASVSAENAGSQTTSADLWIFPVTASYLGISAGKHALELGGGPTFLYITGTTSESTFGLKASASGMTVLGDILIGYRIHPENGGFQFRTGFTGLFGNGLAEDDMHQPTVGFLPWFYISLGACF